MKHTPGPWTFDHDSYTVESGGLIIASVCTVDDYSGLEEECKPQFAEECAANAVLIAAAPDLYEALDRALGAINDLYRERAHDGHCSLWEAKQMYNNDGAVIAARAALRKARGEAQHGP